jgi:hypothetical protein
MCGARRRRKVYEAAQLITDSERVLKTGVPKAEMGFLTREAF